jgi:hypothetical protein
MNDLLPQALKEYIELSQQGMEPVATKEELLAPFRKRRGYTVKEQSDRIYRGEEVDYQHVHRWPGLRLPGATMPWDWIPCEKEIHLPEGWTIAFLGARAMPPYILRPRIPELIEDEPAVDWIEEPLEWIERPPSI